ncbi:ABC transporter permease [Chitinophagaceae bacterium LWZ2-11]
MLLNYLKIAWRNLKRNKAYTAINVIGLALGIACGIIIFMLVSYNLSFDNFHANRDRIYRIVTEFHEEGADYSQGVPSPLGKVFKSDYDFAEKGARIFAMGDDQITVQSDNNIIKKFREENKVAFAEPDYFKILNFPLVKGDINTALLNPNTAIITQKMALKYFGTEDAIGKIIKSGNKTDYTITGILKDIPANTDRREEIYFSYLTLKERSKWLASDSSWGGVSSGMECYVLLKPGVTQDEVEKVFPAIEKKYLGKDELGEFLFHLQPLSTIHFDTRYSGYVEKKYLWALALIGLLLIITACVNFVNLATAQSLKRSKEVGIRKTLGSSKAQIFWQFIAETFIITVMAIVLAYGIAYITMPYIDRLFKFDISLSLLHSIATLSFIIVLLVVVVFTAGAYPGFILSGFKPVLALKSKLVQKTGGISVRKVLVVAQFAIVQILIIGTLIIAKQMNYSINTDMGFNKDGIVLLPVPQDDKSKMSNLRNRILNVPGVEKVSFCFQPPASGSNNTTDARYDNHEKKEPFEVNRKDADDQYLSTFGLKLVAGRNIYQSDTMREYIVNEAFVRKMQIKNPQEVIGKTLSINGGTQFAPIVGVVKDFYNYSFRSEIGAICISSNYRNYNNCAVKLNVKNSKAALAAFDKIWNDVYPEYVYSYDFLDAKIIKFYQLESILLKLIQAFAGIAIVIGCLGLYGLVSFMAVQKTKEIGVRKVLGANLPSIIWLFGKEFTRLLLVAFVIAAPLAWWVMHKWLQDYVYKINIGIDIFLLAILSTFIIATVTVGYRSLRAATANPIKSLRTE